MRKIQLDILDSFIEICSKNNLRYFLIGGSLLGAVRHSGFIPWDDDIDIGMPRQDYDMFLSLCDGELPSHYDLVHYTRQPKVNSDFIKIEDSRTKIYDASKELRSRDAGIFIDIFPLDASPDMEIPYNLQIATYRIGRFLVSLAITLDKPRSAWKQVIINCTKYFLHGESLVTFRRSLERLIRKPWTQNTKWVCNYLGVWGSKERFPRAWIFDDIVTLEFENKKYPVINNYHAYLSNLYGDYMQLPSLIEREEARHFTNVYWRKQQS